MFPERKSILERKSMMPPPSRTPLTNRQPFHPTPNIRNTRLADEARASLASGFSLANRPSGIPGCKGRRLVPVPKMQTIPDQRNLRDREVQAAIIRKIVHFLEDRVNPAPPFSFGKPDFLRFPSKIAYQNVFQYLFQCIEPTYQVQKLETEALNLLNQLGYPYVLKQSTMQTITLPTSWALLLGSLDWFIDIIEMENEMYQNLDKIRDDPQWSLLISCFKKFASKGHAQPYDREDTFKEAFEEYRVQKMAEKGIDCNSYDELVARRVAQEQKIHKLEAAIAEAQCVSDKLEKESADCENDIVSMDRYIEEIQMVASAKERTLNEITLANKELVMARENLANENRERERLISTQRISGEQARALVAKRKSVREELVLLRENLNKTEARIYERQPIIFKQSAKIRSDYNAFMSRLRVICEPLFSVDELQQHLAELEQCSVEQAIVEFQQCRNDNKLTRLLNQLKGMMECQIRAVQQADESMQVTKRKLVNEINELEFSKEQLMSKHKLELEQAKRKFGDNQRSLVDAKHSLDVIRQKHQATVDELGKIDLRLGKLHDELAEKHKNYLDYKNRLDAQYNELLTAVLEKVTKLCDHFQQIQDQKKRVAELANEILTKNKEELKQLEAKKKAESDG
ncbi:hypothetical protein niasHS_012573 [Heterodera schachtii]|uniref:Kinetochore protein NDC80 n=2 Tax=Heterodera TaxID=34509 RepID=A0ABD2IHS1_HETSC